MNEQRVSGTPNSGEPEHSQKREEEDVSHGDHRHRRRGSRSPPSRSPRYYRRNRRRSHSRSSRSPSPRHYYDRRRRRRRSYSRSPPRKSSRGQQYEQRRRGARPRSPPPPSRENKYDPFEIDRESRTVFAFNLNLRAEERDLFSFFSRAGPLADIRIIRDKKSGRSKGFAYIEYEKKESVAPAVELSGQLLGGQPVMVKPSEAEKNAAWELAEQQKKSAAQQDGQQPASVAVSNLHPSLNEADIKPIFEPFGAVDSISIQRDALGRSLGQGMVVFCEMSDAVKAAQNLQGLDVVGLQLQLKVQKDSSLPTVTNLPEKLDADADDGGGIKMTAQSRAALMSRLAAGAGMQVPQTLQTVLGGPTVPAATIAPEQEALALEQGVLGPASPIPTPCILLKNMFDPDEETAPSWDADIAEDVRDECQKFGSVEFVHVDPLSKGFVYLMFKDTDSATAAQRALHRRWFAGKQILAEFQFLPIFKSHFQLR